MFLKSFFGLLTLTTTAIADDGLDHLMGKELFERSWVQAPATTKASDGLGPLFNARSCVSCHPRGGSVGFETTGNRTQSAGLLARFGDGTGAGDPYYGKQLQSAALTTVQPEGQVWLDERFNVGMELNGPGLASTTGVGLRRAPTLAGRGLFSDISDKALLKNADPFDADTVTSILAEQRAASQGVQRIAENAWFERVRLMDARARAAYADRLEDVLRRGSKRHRERNPD